MAAIRLPLGRVWATYVFMGLIALVFAAQFATQQLIGVDVVVVLGAKVNSAIAEGEYWRLVTAVFIHAGLVHFLFNMYALYYLGQQVEAFAGPFRFAVIFLCSGITGASFSLLLNPSPSVGASGGIFGLIGAMAVFFYRNRALFGQRGRQQLQGIVAIAVINLLIGLQGGIDNWGHVGGLLAGLVLSWFVGPIWQVQWSPASGEPAQAVDVQAMTGRWGVLAALLAGFAAFVALGIVLTVTRYR
jgi:membrane associated rhomboid family serine protease